MDDIFDGTTWQKSPRPARQIHPRDQHPADPPGVAGWVLVAIWSAISSHASATSRWMRLRPGSIFTPVLAIPSVRSVLCRRADNTALASGRLYERRQFRWKPIEPLPARLGLSIRPPLIITHLAACGSGHTLSDTKKLYPQVFYAYWIVWPTRCG